MWAGLVQLWFAHLNLWIDWSYVWSDGLTYHRSGKERLIGRAIRISIHFGCPVFVFVLSPYFSRPLETTLICWFCAQKRISYYYQCWKQLCCLFLCFYVLWGLSKEVMSVCVCVCIYIYLYFTNCILYPQP